MSFVALDRVTPDSSYPDVRVDIMLPVQGALWYVDPMHPANQWPSGLPSSLPNLVWKQAAALIPDSTEQTLAPLLTFNSQFLNDGKRDLAERTTTGALHIIEGLETLAAESQARITLPEPLRAYMLTNKAHEYFYARWGRITRGPVFAVGGQFTSRIGALGNTMSWLYVRPGAGETEYPTDARRKGAYHEGSTSAAGATNQLLYQDMSSIDTTVSVITGWILDSTRSAGKTDTVGSYILYGAYGEDLTVSGRTYTQAHAAVFERYTSTVKTPGGRYYGDAWTDPTTVHD